VTNQGCRDSKGHQTGQPGASAMGAVDCDDKLVVRLTGSVRSVLSG
jgi:hypothetical protein